MLAGRDLVVLGLGRDAERPELVVELLHEIVDRGADRAKVVLLELLPLAGSCTKERASGNDEVRPAGVILLFDEEVLLLVAHTRHHAAGVLAKERKHALGLRIHSGHRTQKRRLLIERLARIGAKRRGDAEHLVFDEGGRSRVPSGVAARLKRGAEPTVGEARRVRLALDELFAAELRDSRTVSHRVEERLVLLGRDAAERLEPVRVVRGAAFDCPGLHGMRDIVCHIDVERPSLAYRGVEFFVHVFGQIAFLLGLAEHHRAKSILQSGHRRSLLTALAVVRDGNDTGFTVPSGRTQR